jgi:hypothetical protein
MIKTLQKKTVLLLAMIFLVTQIAFVFAAPVKTERQVTDEVPVQLQMTVVTDGEMKNCYADAGKCCQKMHCAFCSVIISKEISSRFNITPVKIPYLVVTEVPRYAPSAFFRPPQTI